jgi:hypothetical protein
MFKQPQWAACITGWKHGSFRPSSLHGQPAVEQASVDFILFAQTRFDVQNC